MGAKSILNQNWIESFIKYAISRDILLDNVKNGRYKKSVVKSKNCKIITRSQKMFRPQFQRDSTCSIMNNIYLILAVLNSNNIWHLVEIKTLKFQFFWLQLLRFFSHGTLCKIECLSANFCSRYDAITHPMNFTGSWRRAKVLVIAAWILSAAFASPMLHFYHTKETGSYAYGVWSCKML